jgi:hypothetical protein
MVFKDDQTTCLALRDELAPAIIRHTERRISTCVKISGDLHKVAKKRKRTHLSRTSNKLVIRPPATVSCMALFPKTKASLLALCTVTSAEINPRW